MFDHNLKIKLKTIYGFASKNIPLILGLEGCVIENFITCHDGKKLVYSYSKSKPDNLPLKMLSDCVDAFEKRYGDSTTFLSLLIAELCCIGKEISEKDLNNVLENIDNQTEKEKDHLWLKTVLKNDKNSDEIANLIISNKIHRVKKGTIGVPEDFFEVKKIMGYDIITNIDPMFRIPILRYCTDIDVFVDRRKITPSIFHHYQSVARSCGTRIVVACDFYDTETEETMNDTNNCSVILVRMPLGREYILDDLEKVLCAEQSSAVGVSTTKANVSIVNDTVTFCPIKEAKIEDLNEYKMMLRDSCPRDSESAAIVENRIRKIMEGQINEIYINATTKERMNDLYEMINDVLQSIRHAQYGFIKGYMQWHNSDKISYLNIALDEVKKSFEGKKPDNFFDEAYDSAEIIRNAIITAVKFNNEMTKIDFEQAVRYTSLNH